MTEPDQKPEVDKQQEYIMLAKENKWTAANKLKCINVHD